MNLSFRTSVASLAAICLLVQVSAGSPGISALGLRPDQSRATLQPEKDGQVPYRIVATYQSKRAAWLPVDEIPFQYVDQIDHFSIHPDAGGTLDVPPGFVMPALIERAHLAGRRVVLVVGGAAYSSAFAAMTADPTDRASFVRNLVAFVVQQGYDGVTIDWEVPQTPADGQNLNALMAELRTGLDATGRQLELSIAIPKNETRGQWIDVETIAPLVSHFVVMTFRYYGPGASESGHNAPLYPSPAASDPRSVDGSLRDWAETRGVPWSKLYMGTASFGSGFDSEGLNQPFKQHQQEEYHDIKLLIGDGYTRHWDNVAQVPYLTQDDGLEVWSYDDPQSIGIKRDYALAHGMGGVAVWDVTMDRVGGEHELLKVLAHTPAPNRAFVPLVRRGK